MSTLSQTQIYDQAIARSPKPIVAPLDAVALTAVSGVAVPLFQSLIDSGGKILGLFGRQIDRATKQTIYTASGEYANRYTQRHGQIKLLGMRQPLDLGAVSVPLLVSIENEARRFASVEESEQGFAQTGRFAQPSGVVLPALELARQRPYVMVLGTPGTGKTTVLRQVGLEALRGKATASSGGKGAETGGENPNGAIPVFIELKRFTDREFNLHDALVNEFEVCGFPEADGFVEIALDRGKLLILLDGLDELPGEQRNGAIGKIQDFVDRHNKNRFLCSCRSSVYQYNLKQFVDAVVLNLTPPQVEQFLHQWAIARPVEVSATKVETPPASIEAIASVAPDVSHQSSNPSSDPALNTTSENLEIVTHPESEPNPDPASESNPDPGSEPNSALNSDSRSDPRSDSRSEDNTTTDPRASLTPIAEAIAHDPELAELSRSPLLLTLLSLTDPASLLRVSNRPFLYQEIIELYLRTWSDLKRVSRSPIYPDFGSTLQQQLLGEIALDASRNQRVFLARRGLVDTLKRFLQTRLQAPDHLDGDAILDAIVVQQGILTERSRDVFSFDHAALQAYCAAMALGDQRLSDREIEAIASQYLGDPLWRSIFPLWLDRLGDRGAVLVQALEKAAKKMLDPLVVAWLADQGETLAITSVNLEALQPWRSVLCPLAIAPIAAALHQRVTPSAALWEPSANVSEGVESSRLSQGVRQLWAVLQTDVLAGASSPESGAEPTAAAWRAIAVYLVALETIARCR